MDESNLSRIENNKVRRPALRVIPALAEVLDLEPGQMFERDVAA
jgi:transcriptional regulator with XRE-family HTH domain